MRSGGIVNAFWLKIIMLILMVLDHLYYYLFPRELLHAHYAARVVAPVFVFLMAQSMVFTRNRARYILRLFLFGALMAIVNLMLSLRTGIRIPNNIFLSLAVSSALLYSLDEIISGDSRPRWIFAAVIFFTVSLYCEGKYLIPLMAVIFYYLRHNRAIMYTAFVVLTGLPYFGALLFAGKMEAQLFMVFAVIPIMLYNGERGPDTFFAKYVFYFFYPLHVWVIVLIKAFALTA